MTKIEKDIKELILTVPQGRQTAQQSLKEMRGVQQNSPRKDTLSGQTAALLEDATILGEDHS